MTLGLTDIFTASSTSRPARSMARLCSNSSGICADCAAISESTTRSTLPPRQQVRLQLVHVQVEAALVALIMGSTIL